MHQDNLIINLVMKRLDDCDKITQYQKQFRGVLWNSCSENQQNSQENTQVQAYKITKNTSQQLSWVTAFPLYKMVSNCRLQKQSPEMFYKKGVLKKFAIFTEKHLCQTIYKVALKFFIKNRLQHRYFETQHRCLRFHKVSTPGNYL